MTSAFRRRVTARDGVLGQAHLEPLSRCLAAVTSLRWLQRKYPAERRLGAEWTTMTGDA